MGLLQWAEKWKRVKWRNLLDKLGEQGEGQYREERQRPEGENTEKWEGPKEGRGKEKQEVRHVFLHHSIFKNSGEYTSLKRVWA